VSRAGLTRAKIADAALTLIDEIGIDAFSMRKLGQHLGVDPMAIYRHFQHREDLFDAVAELLFDHIDVNALPWNGRWRDLAGQYCQALLSVLQEHPHAVTTFATRPIRSNSSISSGVRMIECFVAGGFSPENSLRVARSLRELTIGHALSLSAVQLGSQTRSRKPAPEDPNYNLLAKAADSAGIDDHFDIALTAMLDGFENLRESAASAAAG